MAKRDTSRVTRNRSTDTKSTSEKPSSDVNSGSETSQEDSKSTLARLSIPLDDAGLPAFDQMRETTKAKLAKMLTDPATAKSLGVSNEPGAPAADVLPDIFFLPLVQVLSGVETMILARVTGAPGDIVARIAPYSREEMNQIVPLIAKIANKHAGKYLSKWGDEAMLVVMLGAIGASKAALIREELSKRGPAIVTPFRPPAPVPVTDATEETPGDPLA